VIIAWRKLYRYFPNYWETICIFLHDVGHWGKDYLNNYEHKRHHAELGAKIAGRLFGKKGYGLVFGHNAYNGNRRSKLYQPDKYSWVIAPIWWMISNTFFEPKLIRKGCTRRESALMFKAAMAENMRDGFKEQGHDIYLKQWGHYQNASEEMPELQG
jgi:hypothetical protein